MYCDNLTVCLRYVDMSAALGFLPADDSDQDDYGDFVEVRSLLGRGRPRQLLPRDDPFYRYDEADFVMRFRLSKAGTIRLLSRIEDLLAFGSLRNCPLSPMNQHLVTLRFYATGTFQIVLADLWGVHKSTVCRAVRRVTNAIASLARELISFPTTQAERRAVSQGFYAIHKGGRGGGYTQKEKQIQG